MSTTIQTDSLINVEAQDKLNYISIVNSESVGVDGCHSLQKPNNIVDGHQCLLNDNCDEDEHKSKSRARNPENWKQNVRKRNKNKGLEYIKANGEICEKKKLGPPCTCREKCYLKIGMDACKKIFQNFWKLGDHSLQNAYIAGCVRIFLPKHCYKKDGVPSRRFFSRNFHVTVNGVDTEICKQAFLNVHAISNGRLDRLLKKKQEIGNTGFDERGRHSNKVNKIPLEKIRLVRKHIDSVRQKSGYTGKRKPKKVEILPSILNIRTMYRSYKEEMLEKGLDPVCEYRYRKIFHTDFHLDFGKAVGQNTNNDLSHSKQQIPLQQLQEQQQRLPPPVELQQITNSISEPAISHEKQMNKFSQRNVKKIETYSNLSLQDMNINLQLNSNIKPNRQMPVYSQLGTQDSKDYQLKGPETMSYVFSQEVFRLDYSSSYNIPQQNWVFSNQNQ